jgi:hypothetical protein
MQTIVLGCGSGGRTRTALSGLPCPLAAASSKRLLNSSKPADQSRNEVLRKRMGNRADHVGDVHHGVTVHHAEPVVVEE